MCDEEGDECETLHTHIFIYRRGAFTWQQIDDLFPDCHRDNCYGTPAENRAYIRKDGEKFHKDDTGVEIGREFFAQVAANASGTPPDIKVNLGAANSAYGYNYGGEVVALDLSWYAQYKPTVDAIVGGFLWLLFLWALFKKAPRYYLRRKYGHFQG